MNHPLALHYNNYYYIDTYASGSWGSGTKITNIEATTRTAALCLCRHINTYTINYNIIYTSCTCQLVCVFRVISKTCSTPFWAVKTL